MSRPILSLGMGVLLLGLTACQTASENANLTQAQALAHISGNTEVWSKGGAYYAPDGTLQVLWEGQESTGTWKVNTDGEVCNVVEIWGSKPDCHSYVNDDGEIKLLWQGEARARETMRGNQLDSL